MLPQKKKVRLILGRKGFKREYSNWHTSRPDALQCILDKINNSRRSPHAGDVPGVKKITKSLVYSAMGSHVAALSAVVSVVEVILRPADDLYMIYI